MAESFLYIVCVNSRLATKTQGIGASFVGARTINEERVRKCENKIECKKLQEELKIEENCGYSCKHWLWHSLQRVHTEVTFRLEISDDADRADNNDFLKYGLKIGNLK